MSSPTASGASAAAAAAADARLRAAAALRDAATGGLDEAAFKLKVKRIVDKEICASASAEVASKCMRLFHTLLSNIVDNPSEGKFRAFKAEQPRIKRELLAVYGAKDLLVLLLFRTRTADFKEEWYFADAYQPGCEAWRKLELARSALGEYARVKEDTAERLREIAEREKVAEQTRVARAMAAAEEDRERVRQRAEREKHARLARQRAAAAQAEAAAQQGGDPASEQAKAEPVDNSYRAVGHYDEDEEEGSDGSEQDYGSGAGRRLGD